MKRTIITYLIIFLFPNLLFGQQQDSPQDTGKVFNTISREVINNLHIELLGQGVWYSLNYERVLHKNSPLVFRGGISFFTDYREYLILDFPVSFSILFGKRFNFLEMGVGIWQYINMEVAYAPESYLFGNAIIGYRRQVSRGLMFRIFYSPFIDLLSNNLDSSEYVFGIAGHSLWGGISIGYSFSKKSK